MSLYDQNRAPLPASLKDRQNPNVGGSDQRGPLSYNPDKSPIDPKYRVDPLKNVPDYLKFNLSEQNALPWQQYLDRGVNDIAGNIARRATNNYGVFNNTPDEIKGQLQAGVGEDSIKTSANPGGSMMGQGAGNAMSEAINRRFNEQNAQRLQDVGANFNAKVPGIQQQELSRAGGIYAQQYAKRLQNFNEQLNFQQQRAQMYLQQKAANEAALGGVISSVLNLGAHVAIAGA